MGFFFVGEILAGVATTSTRHPKATEPALWDAVGDTPLLPIEPTITHDARARLLLKAEWLNPGGSVKDRPARGIIRAGLAEGALPHRRLLDASSGNTAVAYAMLGAAAGIGVTVCVPANASPERFRLLELYGAEVIETDPLEGSDGAIGRAKGMARSDPETYWYPDQYSHAANAYSHYHTTGPEIWRDTRGAVTHLVAGVGTSGTLMGAGRFLREMRPEVRLIAVEPDSPFHGLEGLKHMASAIVPRLYDPSLIDDTVHVETESAESKVRYLAREHGLCVGWSTGAALVAAERLLIEHPRSVGHKPPVVVAIGPDGGTRYLSQVPRWFGV